MAAEVALVDDPSPDDRAAILRGLVAFNDERFGPSDIRPLAVLLRDEAGETIGGLWGRTTYGWLYVELLFVPEGLRGRGLGARLLAEAERAAAERGATNAWIDCFGQVNRDVYVRCGYEVFGALPGMPPGETRYFLKKAL
ncbi:GNAT family N-acetyltransferase [Chenggangzhangella methanolivorans]|uniref:GNAT family N-acetyltransferase n=1 Tax=Chenggangzhangella methanolivorans TaxID=1437009 RepID=UPI0021BD2264|nr:GNAT family N-acetyltransferase [Chenggangzhangella methanolivorans]